MGMWGEIGRWVDGSFTWDLRCRRPFFVHEEPLVTEFLSGLRDVRLSEERDRRVWRHNRDDIFSIAYAYHLPIEL